MILSSPSNKDYALQWYWRTERAHCKLQYLSDIHWNWSNLACIQIPYYRTRTWSSGSFFQTLGRVRCASKGILILQFSLYMYSYHFNYMKYETFKGAMRVYDVRRTMRVVHVRVIIYFAIPSFKFNQLKSDAWYPSNIFREHDILKNIIVSAS